MKKKLSVSGSSPHSVVFSMATALNVDYIDGKHECRVELPEDFGKGFVQSHAYDDGFGVVRTNYQLSKDFHFELSKELVHPLKIIFNICDTFQHKLKNDKSYTEVKFAEVMIVSSTQTNNHKFIIPAKLETNLFSIEVNRKLFERRIIDFMDEMGVEMSSLFRDVNGVIPFMYKGSFSYDIGVMIDESNACELKGMNRSLYLESKAYEVLTCFLEQYKDDSKQPVQRSVFRLDQSRSIKRASEFIKNHLEDIPNVHGIAGKFGLNTNILQNGFKTIYGMTVNEYIQNERLLTAKKLLSESELSISEITYKVGLNSKSYLSKIFMERFKLTPSQFRSGSKGNAEGTN